MVEDKKRYKITIAGHTYTIIGTETKSHMDLISQLANDQLKEIKRLSPETDMSQAAILLAINALSDQIKKQQEIIYLEDELKEAREQAAKAEELEIKLQRIEALEKQAKQALKKNGENKSVMNHIEAQQILNQQTKEKIQQNHQEKNNIE